MSTSDSTSAPSVRFAARVSALRKDPEDPSGSVKQIDPATIALIIAIVRLVLIWIERRKARELRNWAISLQAPRRWQFLCIQRRVRLLEAVRKRIANEPAANSLSPAEWLDSVLAGVVNSPETEM